MATGHYLAKALSVLSVLAVVGCGSHSSGDQTATPTGTSVPTCPNPEGGSCRGPLRPGTYRSSEFLLPLTYTVPAGWSNEEDTRGNFLLVPPRGTLRGVGTGTSDFIGVYVSVGAANGCRPGIAPRVGTSPAEIMRWIGRDPALKATPPHTVAVGGVAGLVTTLRMAPGWRGTCPSSRGRPVAPLLVGAGASSLAHSLVRGEATRLYLLELGDTSVAIEVVDTDDAGRLARYAAVVDQFQFPTS